MTEIAEADQTQPPAAARRTALLALPLSLLVAALALFGAIFPVELGWDPLGIGRAIGLGPLVRSVPAAQPATAPVPAAGAAASRPAAYAGKAPASTITLTIPLKAGGDPERRDEVEYKVAMEPGQMILYSWQAQSPATDDDFYSDFHGHVVTGDPENVSATIYREGMGAAADGGLVAPFAGVHGWYFQNQSDHDVVVRLKISGFFALVPPGKPGNEAGLSPDP